MSAETKRSPRWSSTTKITVALTAVVLVGWVIVRFQNLITPLIVAAMMAYLLNPLITFLAQQLRWHRTWVAALIYSVLLLVLAASATGLTIYTVNQISNLNLRIIQIVEGLPERIQELIRSEVTIFGSRLDLSQFDFTVLYDQVVASIRPALSQIGASLGAIASGTAEFFGWALFVLVISFYIVKDLPSFGGTVSRYAADPGYEEDVARLMLEFQKIWNAFLRGQAVLAISIGLVVWVGLTVLGVRFAFGLALLSALLEFVPIIGPLVAGAVAVGVALFQNSNWLGLDPLVYAVVVALFFVVVQQLENNLFVPRIIGEHLQLHPVVIMVGAIMGATLGGIIGLLLSAPVLASLRLFGKYAWRKMLDIPPFSEAYREPERKPLIWLPDVRRWFRRKSPQFTEKEDPRE